VSPETPVRAATNVPPPDDVRRPPGSASPDRWHFAFGVDAAVSGGLAPRWLFSSPVGFEAVAPRWFGLVPSVQLRFERAWSGTVGAGGPSATFAWTLGALLACPHRWHVSVTPCARVEAGAIESSGANVQGPRDDTRGWFALGAALRAQWWFFDPLFLDVEGGVRAPVVRPTYVFEPNTTVFQPPTLAGTCPSMFHVCM
jgi:hypothetical protein